MKRCYLLTTLILLLIVFGAHTESVDASDEGADRFCYPGQYRGTRKSCECTNDSAPPWGIRAVNIDCSYKDFNTKDISEVLPLYVNTVDLSWNALDRIPMFASDSLRLLNLIHNNITSVSNKNFVKVSNLRELYLSWNSIQMIELNAFDDLAHLQVLDLSHNNIQSLGLQIFRPLLVLETLSLSWNRQLNKTESIQDTDFYRIFGVNTNLRTLRLQACSLSGLLLPEKAPLVELDLRRNLLEDMPSSLPRALRKLDISENLFKTISLAQTANLSQQLSELYVEDMPRLQSVDDNAFVPLQSLQKVSFQNSRRLTTFSGLAFGEARGNRYPALRSIIFRGTSMRTINATMASIFQQLTEVDLNGMPLLCDCELVWIKTLRVETNGRCFTPSRMRGERLTNAKISDFSCDRWPHWVAGIFILGLILLCAVCIYAIVMCLRPNRGGVTMRKVGAGSPYSRVTIEPNRQEHY